MTRQAFLRQGDVVVAAPRCCLVDPDSRHVAEVLQLARRRNVVVKHAPYTVVPDLEKIGYGLHRHLSGHGDYEGIEQLAEAAAAARPRNRDLSGLAALRATEALMNALCSKKRRCHRRQSAHGQTDQGYGTRPQTHGRPAERPFCFRAGSQRWS
jgi:hypothetical protein